MSIELIIYLIFGGTLGVLSRLFITRKNNLKLQLKGDNFSTVNFISSFMTGIYIALDISSKKIILFFSIGFLGCFSTFSSFIFYLFTLLKEQKYMQFLKFYFFSLINSFLLVFVGFFVIKIIFK